MKQIKGIVFLSTPHTGSHLAQVVGILNNLLRNNISVQELEANNPWLREIDEWYRQGIGTGKFKISTKVYYETKDTLGYRVVDESSADPKILNVMPVAVPADHINIAKPTDKEDLVYEGVRNFIQDFFQVLLNPPPPPQPLLPPASADSGILQPKKGDTTQNPSQPL
jgi:hypothetical protein